MTPSSHPLDRPAWSALTSGWDDVSERSGPAVRLKRDYGPFAATDDLSPASLAALLPSLVAGEETWLVETESFALPAAIVTLGMHRCVQMVATTIDAQDPGFDSVTLGEDDAGEMRALAELTRPGPFRSRTHQLGRFIGVRENKRLVAMAGERMRLDGHVEVSGVCTHPDFRGRGYAGGLMRQVAGRILAMGDTPFLHAYEANAGAIALYQTLGFRIRARLMLTVVTR